MGGEGATIDSDGTHTRDSWFPTHSPVTQSDEHDTPGSVNELVQGVAAVVDDQATVTSGCFLLTHVVLRVPDEVTATSHHGWSGMWQVRINQNRTARLTALIG